MRQAHEISESHPLYNEPLSWNDFDLSIQKLGQEVLICAQNECKILNLDEKVILVTQGLARCYVLMIKNHGTNTVLFAHIQPDYFQGKLKKDITDFLKKDGEKQYFFVFGSWSCQFDANRLKPLLREYCQEDEDVVVNSGSWHFDVAYDLKNNSLVCGAKKDEKTPKKFYELNSGFSDIAQLSDTDLKTKRNLPAVMEHCLPELIFGGSKAEASPQEKAGNFLENESGSRSFIATSKDRLSLFQPLKVQNNKFLQHVAYGEQDKVEEELHSRLYRENEDRRQQVLCSPGRFTDYSGRSFNCTAYEYAYWAKDTYMCRMLQRYMDDETKAILAGHIIKMEKQGLTYEQNGIRYQNPHYDMSFTLKKLSPEELMQLKTLLAEKVDKIKEATLENYRSIAFTAIEFENLKKELTAISPESMLHDKLLFDFHSLITALQTYVNSYGEWMDRNEGFVLEAVMRDVGKAQRQVPAHVAQEYCRRDRSFVPTPSFKEEILPRGLTCYYRTIDSGSFSWFPLEAANSALGDPFALTRKGDQAPCYDFGGPGMEIDLAAIIHLDAVRTAELTELHEHLNQHVILQGMSI